MSSPRSPLKMFFTRSGTLPVSSGNVEEPAVEDTVSEQQRDDIFQACLYDFQDEVLKEEQTQSVGERSRVEEFDQTLAKYEEMFSTSFRRHQDLYQEADAQQEGIYKAAETVRETVFADGQKERVETFRSEQELRLKRSEWHSSAREMLIQKAREKWDEACMALDAGLVGQFTVFLSRQEEEFVSEERRRDGLVERLLEGKKQERAESPDSTRTARTPPTIRPASPPRSSPRHYPGPGPMIMPAQSRSRSRSRSSRRSYRQRSRSRSPMRTYSPYQGPPVTVLPPMPHPAPVVVLPPSGSRSSSRSSSRSRRRRSRSRSPIQVSPGKNATKGSDGEASVGPYDEQYTNAEQARQGRFLQEEYTREVHFQAAEEEREAFEDSRSFVYEKKANSWSTKFNALLDTHSSRYASQESARGEGEVRRDAISNAAQERRSQIFAMLLSQLENQAEAEENLEEELARLRKGALEALYERQKGQLRDALEDQRYRFRKAQERRDGELGVPIPSLVQVTSLYDHNAFPGFGYDPGQYVPPMMGHPPIIAQCSYGCAVKTAATLFRGGPNIQTTLPIPGSDDPLLQVLRHELKFIDTQRRYQRLFEKSQEKREELFENAVRKRRYAFRTAEARRVVKFEKLQRQRKERFAEQEDSRESTFREAQQGRERAFLDAERERHNVFRRKEGARDEAFRRAQEDQAERFHTKQMALQKRCIDAGKKRILDLDAWGRRLLQDREREQKRIWEEEQRGFDRVFRLSLGAFVSRN
ncbi:hypothetical protein DXG01_003196 [Tephrocybe rancida]|nr:hypothetical protein DXG01_003196 [Tephrocybe rancida]